MTEESRFYLLTLEDKDQYWLSPIPPDPSTSKRFVREFKAPPKTQFRNCNSTMKHSLDEFEDCMEENLERFKKKLRKLRDKGQNDVARRYEDRVECARKVLEVIEDVRESR